MAENDIDQYFSQLQTELDERSAYILLEVSEENSLRKAEGIVEKTGNRVTEIKHLRGNVFLLKLNGKEMREIALKLTEKGFTKIKGINAITDGTKRAAK